MEFYVIAKNIGDSVFLLQKLTVGWLKLLVPKPDT